MARSDVKLTAEQRKKAKRIAEERAAAGLGDLVMKAKTPTEETTTRYSKPAYGPIRKTVTKKKPKKES